MSSISLPLSTKDKEGREVFNAIVYKYKRKLWIYIRFEIYKGKSGLFEFIGKSGLFEFIDSDKKENKFKGCFVKKCFIGRTCSYPTYYMRDEV